MTVKEAFAYLKTIGGRVEVVDDPDEGICIRVGTDKEFVMLDVSDFNTGEELCAYAIDGVETLQHLPALIAAHQKLKESNAT